LYRVDNLFYATRFTIDQEAPVKDIVKKFIESAYQTVRLDTLSKAGNHAITPVFCTSATVGPGKLIGPHDKLKIRMLA
jgi:hypothetical protein